MSKNKIGFTAECVALMRSERDAKYAYFVSPWCRFVFRAVKTLVPRRKIGEIIAWRLRLSDQFDGKIAQEEPEQIIDLASGYSLRGLELCSQNPTMRYIDSDLPDVVARKKVILNKLCATEGIALPKNYTLVPVDVLDRSNVDQLADLVQRNKRTLIIAEGLTSYFDEHELTTFMANITMLLDRLSDAQFFSHIDVSRPKGSVYHVLRTLVAWLTGTKKRKRFVSVDEFVSFMRSRNAIHISPVTLEGFVFYTLSGRGIRAQKLGTEN